jgi:hypothetical protein
MSTTNDILYGLSAYEQSPDPRLQSIARNAKSLTENFANGSLSADEYGELLQDLETQTRIVEGASDLAAQKQLNTIVNAAITIAAIAAKAI